MPAVFISYSRTDKDFVHRLHDALGSRGYEVWVDWEDIPPSAEWFEEIRAGVAGADGFVYVISPDSVASEVCSRELQNALEQRKRIVPVLRREPNGATVPDEAASLNWVFLRDEDDFGAGVELLTAAVETDLEHVRTHTRLGVQAGRWESDGRDKSLLLRGSDLAAAEAWIVAAGAKEPGATTLQREYVLASRQAATRRQRTVIGGVSIALAVAVVLAVVALIQRSTAIHERNVAYARQLDAQAQNQYGTDPELSVLLATKAAEVDSATATAQALRAALARSHVRQTFRFPLNDAGDAVWSPDGRTLLVTAPGLPQGTGIYRPGSSAPLVRLPAPSFRNQSSWDAKGDRVVIGGAHPAVYDAATGHLIARVPGTAPAIAISRDGTRVATVDLNYTGHVFDVATGRRLASFTPAFTGGVTCFAWSPDDSVIAQCDTKSLATASSPASLDTWDPRTGRLLHAVPTHELIGTVAFSPDSGRYVFTTTNLSAGKTIRSLVVAEGKPGTFVYDTRTGREVTAFPGGASAATFSPDGSSVAYATVGDDLGHVANLISGLSHPLTGHTGVIKTIRFNRVGTYVVTGGEDNTARVYDASTGQFLEQLAGDTAAVRDASFGLNDKLIATTSLDGTARLWASPDPLPSATLPGLDSSQSIGFSADGTKIVEAERSGQGRILSPADLRLLAPFSTAGGQGFAGAAAGHKAPLVAALTGPLVHAAAGGTFVNPVRAQTFDLSSGHGLAQMTPPAAGASLATGALDYAGDRLVTVDASGNADEWNARTGAHLVSLPGSGFTEAVSYSRDGSMIAIAHLPPIPATVRFQTQLGHIGIDLWNARTGHLVRRIAGDQLASQIPGTKDFGTLALAFSPDGKRIAVSGAQPYIELYATASGRQVGHLNPNGEYVGSLAFSPDGKLLAAGTAASAFVWRLPDPHALPEFQHADASQYGFEGPAIGVQVGFTADSRILVTSGDLALEAWDPADHQQLFKVFAAHGALNPAGTQFVAATAGGVSVYPCDLCGDLPRLLAVAKRDSTRDFTPSERRTYLTQG